MHDPMVVVFDVEVPVPRRDRWSEKHPPAPRWTLGRRTFRNPEHLGQPIYPWWRPTAWQPRLAGRVYRWRRVATIWHVEPNDADSGTVCKGMRDSESSWHNARWAWQHRTHLEVHVLPYRRVRRWLKDRCGECGRRFFWKDERHGYMGGDAVYHRKCMDLSHVRGQLNDATKYIQFTANDTERWRVEYRLQKLAEKAESEAAS